MSVPTVKNGENFLVVNLFFILYKKKKTKVFHDFFAVYYLKKLSNYYEVLSAKMCLGIAAFKMGSL